MKYSPYLIVVLFSMFSTTLRSQQTDLNQFKPLCGAWKMQNGKEQIIEEWNCVKADVFTGRSYTVKENGDTLISEKLKLVENNGQVFYIPEVIDQNDGAPVPFKLTNSELNHWTFVNKSHDFPQQIEYIYTAPDKLMAIISGTGKNGKIKKIEINFVRVN